MLKLENILEGWALCPICYGPHRTGRGLCEHCEPEMSLLRRSFSRTVGELSVQTIFEWNSRPDSSMAIEAWVRGLKNKIDPRFWFWPAFWAIENGLSVGPGSAIVPAPTSRTNHALGFARALGSLLGVEVHDVLRIKSVHWQKSLKREDRLKREIEVAEGFDCRPYRAVLIVDDVVTTGNTIYRCWEALGHPKASAVAVFDRPLQSPSCENDSALL